MKRKTKRIKYRDVSQYQYLYVNTQDERFLCVVKEATYSSLEVDVLYFYKEDKEHQKNLPMMYINCKPTARRVFESSSKLRKIDSSKFAEFLL